MKILYSTFTMILLTQTIFAQAPQRFNYQAVARNSDGDVIGASNLGIRASIVDIATSSILYAESHTKTTNNLGLFKLEIGGGTVISGDLSSINWGVGTYSLKIDIDFAGGSDYLPIGSSQILSVPYALHAESANNVDDADADPANEIQSLSIDGTTLSISGGNSVNLPASGGGSGDDDPNNEIQDLSSSKSGSQLSLAISKGGGGTSFSVSDADSSTTNEIQSLSLSGNTLSISDGNSVELPSNGGDADADPMNEIQTLSKSGNTISLSQGGGSVTDSIEDADADPMNEIQDLSLTALADAGIDGMTVYQLNLTGSDPVTLPITEWWQANILLIDPPQVGNVHTPYPVVIENTLDAQSINAQSLETLDLQVGDVAGSGGTFHLTPTGAHFDGGPVSDDLGWFYEREEIRYGVTLPSSDFKSKLTKQDITFSNEGGWTSTYLGGAFSGELSLYPGGGTPQYFRAWINGGSPKMEMKSASTAFMSTTLSSSSAGDLFTYGADGSINTRLVHPSGSPNVGWMGVYDNAGNSKARLFVDGSGNGVIAADVKNFIMDHPLDPEKSIRYSSIEGPEAAAYERGTAKLKDGEAEIAFSEHFQLVIGSNEMTVMITPLSADSKGIAVIEKRTNGFSVKELFDGKGSYEFDWEVKAIRNGFENYSTIINRKEYAPASQFGEKN